MKIVYFLSILIVISFSVNAQEKIGPEEKAARIAWIEKHKILPPNATQLEIEKYYKSLPKSTADSLAFFELQLDNKSSKIQIINQPKEKAIPIPPAQGKEKIIPIPVYPTIEREDKEVK